MKHWQKWGLIGLGTAILISGGIWAYLVRPWETLRVSVSVESNYQAKYEAMIRNFFTSREIEVDFVSEASNSDIAVGKVSRSIGAVINTKTLPQPLALGDEQIIGPDYAGLSVSTEQPILAKQDSSTLLGELATVLSEDVPEQWTLTALGDVILGRQVYARMTQYGMTAPFTAMAKTVNNSDLTLANLECTIADGLSYPTLGMSFTSPAAAMKGLTLAGIDGVNLANNHSLNGGEPGFLNMLDLLKSNHIAYFGGGADAAEAYTAQTYEVKGTKISVLGYSSIAGTVPAGTNTAGHAYFSLPPWGDLKEREIKRMEADIKAAEAQTDLVMVYIHWGAEYTHTASAEMRQVAHRMVDAGADVILGTHPHWVQGIEWYKDRLITYSLGNFVFDQEWSLKTKQGVVLKATFEGNRLISAQFVPYQIEDYYQPRLVKGAVGQQILNDVYSHSWWPID